LFGETFVYVCGWHFCLSLSFALDPSIKIFLFLHSFLLHSFSPISLNKLFLLSLAFFCHLPTSSWVLCDIPLSFITCPIRVESFVATLSPLLHAYFKARFFFAIVLIISLPYLFQTQSFVVTPSLIAYKTKGIVRQWFSPQLMGPWGWKKKSRKKNKVP
jgi:hypothetical protein